MGGPTVNQSAATPNLTARQAILKHFIQEADEKGQVTMSLKGFAKATRRNLWTVTAVLQSLRRQGVITCRRQHSATGRILANRYRLTYQGAERARILLPTKKDKELLDDVVDRMTVGTNRTRHVNGRGEQPGQSVPARPRTPPAAIPSVCEPPELRKASTWLEAAKASCKTFPEAAVTSAYNSILWSLRSVASEARSARFDYTSLFETLEGHLVQTGRITTNERDAILEVFRAHTAALHSLEPVLASTAASAVLAASALLEMIRASGDSGLRAYLSSLKTESSRSSMRHALNRIASFLTSDGAAEASRVSWNRLRREHLVALLGRLNHTYSPAYVRSLMAAVRGVLRCAWQAGDILGEDYFRTLEIKLPKQSSSSARRRILTAEEMQALYSACAQDPSAAGKRDAVILSLLHEAGLRRSEAVSVSMSDYAPDTGTIRITGRKDRQGILHTSGATRKAINSWIDERGSTQGPLLVPVRKGGAIESRPMTGQALLLRVQKRCGQAGIRPCTTNDLRASYLAKQI